MFLGIAPVRISFAGGGTDMPEFFNRYGGNVVTTTIDHFTYVIINSRQDNAFQIFSSDFQAHEKPTMFDKLKHQLGTEIPVSVIKYLQYKDGFNLMISSDVPPQSGLGGSSSLTVNLVKTISTLKGENMSKKEIAETAHNIERKSLKWMNGKQDDYISSFGGFNFIKFQKDEIKVLPIQINKSTLEELEQNLLLFFVGGRTNTNILSDQIERINNNEKDTITALNYVKELGENMYELLKNSNIGKFGELLHEGWMSKKKFSKDVTDNKIDLIYKSAINAGAVGGKITGAGGGGHMLFYCDVKKQKNVIEKMNELGHKQVKFSFNNEGAKILNLYDFAT